MTLGEAINQVQSLGYGSAAALGTAQRRAVMQTVRRVASARRWRWNIVSNNLALLVGTSSVAVTTGTRSLVSVRAVSVANAADVYTVEPAPRETVVSKLFLDPTGTGAPLYWARDGSNVLVYPKSDQAYTLVVQRVASPTTLATDGSADATELPGPEDYHDVYVWGACYRLAARERDANLVSLAREEYNIALAEMTRSEGLEHQQGGRRVQKSGFFADDVVTIG